MYRLFSLLSVLLLLISGCTTTPQPPQPPEEDKLSLAAHPLIEQGDFLAASQLYLSAAKTAPENQRIPLRLQAARLLAQGEHWGPLEQLLTTVPTSSLSEAQAADYSLISAQLSLGQHQPETALALLGEIKSPDDLEDNGKRYYQLRAEAYAQSGNALEAARQLIWLDGLISEPQPKLENQYRIWALLSNLTDEALQTLKTAPPPDALSGWMELVLLTRAYRSDRDRWSGELSHWRSRYPRHAAEDALLPDLLYQVGQFVSQANRIAVLLPLSGRAADSAAAIRDGILSAFYSGDSTRPELRFYDTAGDAQQIWSVYQLAIDEGADFVIGPLLKDSIESLSLSGTLPIPVLALNQIGESPENNDLALYQFGLAPEDEAHQVAERAIADGLQQLIALYPDSAWGERVFTAFQQAYTLQGGQVLAAERYNTKGADFGQPIRRALNLDASGQRHRALQRLLGKKLSFEPRKRQDAQGVFLLAFPRQARQIKPQLRFHHAGDLPVYSTSHVYRASADPSIDRDMDGLLFCDIPWVLDREGRWAARNQQVQSLWPERSRRYERLFALGYDAYQVVPWLDTMHLPGFAQYPGATGVLSLDTDKRLHRTLEWARFEQGRPQIVREALTLSTEGQNEPEEQR